MDDLNRSAESPASVPPLTHDDLPEARRILQKYREGKRRLEARIKNCDAYWRRCADIRTDALSPESGGTAGGSGWLFNVILGKHAEAAEAYPEANLLPREPGDEAEADMLTAVLPAILRANDYEQVYSDCAWQKMQQGTGIQGVFWDANKLGGLGDVSIRRVSVLNLFWKPGVEDIEESPHVFFAAMADTAELKRKYGVSPAPEGGRVIDLARMRTEDAPDPADRTLVVDWYYKLRVGGRTVLHYCKFTGDTILYASQNDPALAQTGYYDDGEYPFVFDRLFPVAGSPCGYGYIDVCRGAQDAIDRLDRAVIRGAVQGSTVRYFSRADGAVNEEEFADWTRPFVHVNGNLDDASVRQIVVRPPDPVCVSVLNNKIEELKFCSGNMDVASGSVPSGVTAASAITALQESAGRSGRAGTRSSYRAYARMCTKVVARIRQFYDLPRVFRIAGERGAWEYLSCSGERLRPRWLGELDGRDLGWHLPVFDIDVVPQRENAYTRLSRNELALELYRHGFFDPARAAQSAAALEMMDFTGKDRILGRIRQTAEEQERSLNGNDTDTL